MTLQVQKLTGFMGAQISGLDLKAPIPPEVAQGLRDALDSHQMIVMRGQFLTIDDQKRLNAVFGPILRLPYVIPMAEDADVIAVLKEADEKSGGVFGGEWHSDFSFLENPPAGSVLNAVEIPEVGGDTVWSSQVAAYASLPADLKAIVDGRDAVHVGKPYSVRHAPPKDQRSGASIKMVRDDPKADAETYHPAVVTAGNGHKALFVNPIYTTRFEGMSETESAPILDAIYKHATRPDFSCRLRWQVGDVAVWDNRMSLHYATNDYAGSRRLLYRTTFGGQRPV